VHKQCHSVNITTAHEILKRREWQLCNLTLPFNHSGSWTRKEKMGSVIHRKIVHSQSCTSLAATPKPNHSLTPAKFHPQVMATEAEPSHAQYQQMWNAQPITQIWMWLCPHAIALHVKAHHARPRTIVDSCLRALAMGLKLLVVLVMLQLTTAAAVHGGQTWQTSMNAMALPC
jgi:hypothetical protein